MKQRDIITILIPAFLFIVAWIVFNIYHNSIASTITPTVNVQISPITPIFNINAISKLKERQNITPLYETSTNPSPTPTSGRSIFLSSPSSSQKNNLIPAPQSSAGGLLVP